MKGIGKGPACKGRVLTALLVIIAVQFTAIALSQMMLPAQAQATASIYYRPFNLIYANQGKTPNLPESGSVVISVLSAFPSKPTMITPVLLNTNPIYFTTFIGQLKQITPNLCFAVGYPNYSLLDSTQASVLTSIASNYAGYTTCIRLDHFEDLVKGSTESAVRNFLASLHNMGFQHIIANPWTQAPSDKPWPFIDAAQLAIDTTTWRPSLSRAATILRNSPSGFVVVANYEEPPGQVALAALGTQGSINAMSIAAGAQNSASTPYRWMPPWSHEYDAYSLNTLTWIGTELSQIDP